MQQASETRARVIVVKPGDPMPPIVDLDEVSRDGPVFVGTDVPVQYMFEYLDRVHNLHAFLDDFPEVSMGQAVKAMRERVRAKSVIHSNRDYVSGTPVFKGTRVPVDTLFDFLTAGDNLDDFLEDFPTASREQAIEALNLAKYALESIAYEAAHR
jgi:uncharacterized protein (DUF433 family)